MTCRILRRQPSLLHNARVHVKIRDKTGHKEGDDALLAPEDFSVHFPCVGQYFLIEYSRTPCWWSTIIAITTCEFYFFDTSACH